MKELSFVAKEGERNAIAVINAIEALGTKCFANGCEISTRVLSGDDQSPAIGEFCVAELGAEHFAHKGSNERICGKHLSINMAVTRHVTTPFWKKFDPILTTRVILVIPSEYELSKSRFSAVEGALCSLIKWDPNDSALDMVNVPWCPIGTEISNPERLKQARDWILEDGEVQSIVNRGFVPGEQITRAII